MTTEFPGARRIGSLLTRSSTSPLTPIATDSSEDGRTEKITSLRGSNPPTAASGTSKVLQNGSTSQTDTVDKGDTHGLWRPRTLQKSRPGSMFGSMGKKTIVTMREGTVEDPERTQAALMDNHAPFYQVAQAPGKIVLFHGEVQTTSGLFRKKREHLVLTDTHLIRYKSQARASESFPSIPNPTLRGLSIRHASTASIGSMQDLQSLSSHTSIEGDNAIALKHVVAAYKVEDGRPFFTTEVVHLDEESNSVGSIQLMLHDPKDADLWHTSIRGASLKAKLMSPQLYRERLLQYIVHVLEVSQDYDVEHFNIFRVVRRAKSGGRSSTDDLARLGASVFYLVVGINMVHMISLPDFGESVIRAMDGKAHKSIYGLVSLVAIDVQHADDSFQLCFRSPQQLPFVLELASSSSTEIATAVARQLQFLKPLWLDRTFQFKGPWGLKIEDDLDVAFRTDEYGNFDRTLIAYCIGYRCNPAQIRYAIDTDVEDTPEFRLMAPAPARAYTVLELLAVFRALRYNESFRSISFEGISLQCLHSLVDQYGEDHVAYSSRSGLPIRKYFNIEPSGRSLLYQEVQALALKSNRLRRINFANTLPRRRPHDNEEGVSKDPGCEISAALLPLCRGQLTDIDWISLSGIELGETDLEELGLALDERKSHFRCIDVSRCGLNDRGIQVFLNHLEKQHATMQCVNISDNPGRLQLNRFPITMSRFSQIRRLDLSRMSSTSGSEPLIAPEVLLAWRLEELFLTGVTVNEGTLDAISTYLASEMSDALRCLQMDQCNLTGAHLALLMRSMSRGAGVARDLYLHVSANRLEKGNGEIVKAIEENHTPSHVIMRMVEYQTESRFRHLLQALQKNTTIRSLDISKASLPYDAGEETCEALRVLFEENMTLEELDISGEHAHLEVARFGIGLSRALTGLKKNKALKSLRIEYQNLGLEGANTLSSVLEENDTLTHIFCEHNEISLSGFTVLVNALAKNLTVVDIPFMLEDQTEAVRKVTQGLGDTQFATPSKMDAGHAKGSMRRKLTSLGPQKKNSPNPIQDIDSAVQILNESWEQQATRLETYLQRNRDIADGRRTRGEISELDQLLSERKTDTASQKAAERTSISGGSNPPDIFKAGNENAKFGLISRLDIDAGRSRSTSEVTVQDKSFELGEFPTS